MLVRTTGNCGTMAEWFKAQGRYHSWNETPKRGWVVFYDWNGSHEKRHHVGILESTSGSSVTAIEGNTGIGNDSNGGEVMRRTRSKSYITGYGDPGYASDAQREAIIARAVSQLGIKESPAGSNAVKYNSWYYGKKVSGSAYPWCAVFVSWVFNGTSDTKAESVGAEIDIKLNSLKKGCTGPQVKAVQRMLYSMGYKGADGKAITVDGDWGANTDAAFLTFQKKTWPNESGEWDKVCGIKGWTAVLKGGN